MTWRGVGALLASVGLHAGLLGGFRASRPSAAPAAALPAGGQVAVDVEMGDGRFGAPPRAPPLRARAAKAQASRMPLSAGAAVPAPVEVFAEGGADMDAKPGGIAPVEVGAGAGVESAIDEGTALLAARLRAAAADCYPAAARRFHATGQVDVSFCAGADGRATAVELQGTTGSALLDRAARECLLERAAPLPVTHGCFRLPVHFGGAP